MATPIRIPDIGGTVEKVTLVAWLKQEGDSVEPGDPICEVETDKAVTEIEAEAQGVLLKQVVAEGDEIEINAVIGYVGAEGETIEAAEPQEAAAVPGTGVQTEKSLPKEQLAVARRVLRSIHEIPAVDLSCDFDMTAVLAKRQQVASEQSRKLSYDAFMVYAVSRVIKDFPKFLSHVSQEKVIDHDGVDIAFAAGVDDRLYTPVIKGADELSLLEIDQRLRELADKAANSTLGLEEMEGGSLTVSNLGLLPISSFKMIIPPDQSAALAVGAIEQRPVVRNGELAIAPMVTVVLSVDHKLINGRQGAQFVQKLKEFLESI